jgi:hypothetical protein
MRKARRAIKSQRDYAAALLRQLGDRIPSVLRLPLRRVVEGTEIPGTAADILQFAEQALGSSSGPSPRRGPA